MTNTTSILTTFKTYNSFPNTLRIYFYLMAAKHIEIHFHGTVPWRKLAWKVKLQEDLRGLLQLINQSVVFWECLDLLQLINQSVIFWECHQKMSSECSLLTSYGKLVSADERGYWSIKSLGRESLRLRRKTTFKHCFLCKNIIILEKNKAQCLIFHT